MLAFCGTLVLAVSYTDMQSPVRGDRAPKTNQKNQTFCTINTNEAVSRYIVTSTPDIIQSHHCYRYRPSFNVYSRRPNARPRFGHRYARNRCASLDCARAII